MGPADPMSCIPARRSTIELRQSLKPRSKNWDELLLSAFEDWLPPETVLELERREPSGKRRTFADVERRHPDGGTRRRGAMPSKARIPWKEPFTFLDDAERDFDKLPPEVQQAFLDRFPELSRHPWRASARLDVAPIRDMPGRWRLQADAGHREVYRSLWGRPDFEMFETRDQVGQRLRKYLEARA